MKHLNTTYEFTGPKEIILNGEKFNPVVIGVALHALGRTHALAVANNLQDVTDFISSFFTGLDLGTNKHPTIGFNHIGLEDVRLSLLPSVTGITLRLSKSPEAEAEATTFTENFISGVVGQHFKCLEFFYNFFRLLTKEELSMTTDTNVLLKTIFTLKTLNVKYSDMGLLKIDRSIFISKYNVFGDHLRSEESVKETVNPDRDVLQKHIDNLQKILNECTDDVLSSTFIDEVFIQSFRLLADEVESIRDRNSSLEEFEEKRKERLRVLNTRSGDLESRDKLEDDTPVRHRPLRSRSRRGGRG